ASLCQLGSLQAASLGAITQRGYLAVAVKDNRPPLGFRDPRGNLIGFEIDLARRLAAELIGNAEAVRLVPVTNKERLRVVTHGEVDMAIAAVTATANRARLVSFSTPYYLDGVAILTAKADIQRLADLNKRTIAVLQNSTTIAVIQHTLPTANLMMAASYRAGETLLQSDQADAFAGDASILAGWIQEYPRYRLLPTLLTVEPLCIAMPKGVQHDSLHRRVNQALTRWQDDGWLRQQATSWGLP
ncbi:MAG: transporter substrate-binding domain-containing protein, partial [Cyanobacteria bacterium]|nr:transporter substrate-binding domain-containing protein [Cyanobacteriota bacterium]MDW8202918.1 transporter substrate-binding domain-containing protein [Cyanobacteriota bacterium SKYGB_h_bin112]